MNKIEQDTRRLVCNRIRTPDGTILESRHRHDYKTYIDSNGLEYMVDGGLDYTRRIIHDDAPYVEYSVYSDDSHDMIRESFRWGTRGLSGKEPIEWVLLKDLAIDHIYAILETQRLSTYLVKVFEDELDFRIG